MRRNGLGLQPRQRRPEPQPTAKLWVSQHEHQEAPAGALEPRHWYRLIRGVTCSPRSARDGSLPTQFHPSFAPAGAFALFCPVTHSFAVG